MGHLTKYLLIICLLPSLASADSLPLVATGAQGLNFGDYVVGAEALDDSNPRYKAHLATSICAQRVLKIAERLKDDPQIYRVAHLMALKYGIPMEEIGLHFHYQFLKAAEPVNRYDLKTGKPMGRVHQTVLTPTDKVISLYLVAPNSPSMTALEMHFEEDENGSCRPTVKETRAGAQLYALSEASGIDGEMASRNPFEYIRELTAFQENLLEIETRNGTGPESRDHVIQELIKRESSTEI